MKSKLRILCLDFKNDSSRPNLILGFFGSQIFFGVPFKPTPLVMFAQADIDRPKVAMI